MTVIELRPYHPLFYTQLSDVLKNVVSDVVLGADRFCFLGMASDEPDLKPLSLLPFSKMMASLEMDEVMVERLLM